MADNLVKLMDETGYRQLINMLISIKSSQQEDVDKCISIWQPNTMYQKDKVVLVINNTTYSEYICKATHVSGETFDETYWTLVSCVDFEGYTEEELLAMLNLSETELQNLQNILNDDEISTHTTHSSSKIYAELLTVLSESKKFTIAEIAKIVSFSYKVVSSEDEVVDDKAIYLIENSTAGTYDMYLLVDGSPSKVGNTNINLDEYVKKEDIIDTFDGTATYTDSDKVFSTKASKSMYDDLNDKKISKSNIVTTLDDTVTNGQLIDGKTIVDKFTSIDNKLSLRYNFDSIDYKSYSGRKSAIKSVIKTLKKDGATSSEKDYYENNPIFVIRYNRGYYFTYIMTSYYSKVFILEFSAYTDTANIWCEDEMGEMYLNGTIPITLNTKHFMNPFTSNTSNYKLHDGYYTISGKTCTLTVSIDCISPADKQISLGFLADLNLKASSTTTCIVDLKAEDDKNNVMKFYVGISESQAWLGTAGKRYTGTFTYTIK